MRARLTGSLFLICIFALFILSQVITPPVISVSERRPLATFPKLNLSTLQSAEFMNKFEGYAADSFVFREQFRTTRAMVVLDAFRMLDKDGLFRGQSGLGKFARINEVEYQKMFDKINLLVSKLPSMKVYFAMVPDKSIYAGTFLPGFDLKLAEQLAKDSLQGIKYIDLSTSLQADSFYYTDLHWNQIKLQPVINSLASEMDFKPITISDLNIQGDFFGVYAGQLALPVAPDSMSYMKPSNIDSYQVSTLSNDGTIVPANMYDLSGFTSEDPYNFFLQGPTSLIWIDTGVANNRILYLFRDSFSSSLAPLIAFGESYQEIVLIDLRYIDSRILDTYVTFKPDSDVLFLYSSQIMNNSSVIKISE